MNGESYRDRKESGLIRNVDDESYRDGRQPRLIEDEEIPVPFRGTLDEIEGKMDKCDCKQKL